jgi:hypothetical protein
VINAANFIGDYRSGDYTYDSPLLMTVQDEALDRWRGKRIQARVFVLDASGSTRPESWRKLADCDIFYTFIIKIDKVASNGVLNLGSVNSLGWMRMPDGKLARGRFLVVFESAANENPVFRLHGADSDAYFNRGVIITATHRNAIPASVASVAWLHDDEQRRRHEMAQISSDRVCYRFQIADKNENWRTQLAQLRRCPKPRRQIVDVRASG